jgi:hypothetical protein
MGKVQIPGTSIVYDNPAQVDQSNIVFPPGTTNCATPGIVAGAPYFHPCFCDGIPKPGTFDPTPPKANPVVFRNPA